MSRLSVKVKDREAFGHLCVALTEDQVPFTHTGFQTIVLAKRDVDRLPTESRRLFEEFSASGLIEVFPAGAGGKRVLPTAEKAKELLQKHTQSL